MKAKPLKYLIIGYLTFGLQTASAQLSRYWEDQDHPKSPRATMCHSKGACHVIQSVHQDSWGKFHCKAIKGQTFSCDQLVKQFGTQLEGTVVKVTTPYVDSCHIPGGCGTRACVPSYGAASLDQSCQ